jgi:hypothetical protein
VFDKWVRNVITEKIERKTNGEKSLPDLTTTGKFLSPPEMS